jgi:L-serine dehydratase
LYRKKYNGSDKSNHGSKYCLESDPAKAKVTLDEVIQTMWETALSMNDRLKLPKAVWQLR